MFFEDTCSFENWEIFSDIPQFSLELFGHVRRLDQQATFDVLKFSLIVTQTKEMNQYVVQFPLFMSSRPRFQVEF